MRVGLLFGGCSGEHEVSIKSAQAIAKALASGDNQTKYQVSPFYIQKNGVWLGPEVSQQVLDQGVPLGDQHVTAGQRWQFPPEAAQMEVWFPILHGPNGEDGTVQGLFSLMQVPYVGSGVLGSCVGMDKLAMKMVFERAGLPQVNYMGVERGEIWSNPCVFPALCEKIEAQVGYPCFVKPANLGSSVGIAKVRNWNVQCWATKIPKLPWWGKSPTTATFTTTKPNTPMAAPECISPPTYPKLW